MKKIYYVYEKEGKKNKFFIKKGFNFYAFIFNFFWFSINRMWILFVLFLSIYISLNVLESAKIIDDIQKNIISIGLTFYIGLTANELKRFSLNIRGYKRTSTILEKDIMEARKQFYEQNLKKN
ncbi:DUF2628 domain-containing protein [Anaplasmataceae bacterium AB001_6]|nr:DUF2628 domain-containing protein [Anaplasmataceae bacterium AB001_6]